MSLIFYVFAIPIVWVYRQFANTAESMFANDSNFVDNFFDGMAVFCGVGVNEENFRKRFASDRKYAKLKVLRDDEYDD
jgi:hypothetical protein